MSKPTHPDVVAAEKLAATHVSPDVPINHEDPTTFVPRRTVICLVGGERRVIEQRWSLAQIRRALGAQEGNLDRVATSNVGFAAAIGVAMAHVPLLSILYDRSKQTTDVPINPSAEALLGVRFRALRGSFAVASDYSPK